MQRQARLGLAIGLGAVITAGARLATAEDWPQFLGPDHTGISRETGLMATWPADGPKVVWTVKAGPGFGGVAVRDGEVYLLDREVEKRDILRCLDLATGRDKWQYAYEAAGKISFPGSRSHPAVDADRVYCMGPFGDLHAVDRKTGKPAWHKNPLKEFGGKTPNWKCSQTPLLYGELVAVAAGGNRAGAVAYRRDTGDVVWTSPKLTGEMSYASLIPAQLGGVEQFLYVTTEGVTGLAADDGRRLWHYGDWTCKIPIPSAVPIDENRVFIAGGYDAGAAMIGVANRGGRFTTSTHWRTREVNNQLHEAMLYNGHLYMNASDKRHVDGLACLGLDGSVKWKTGKNPALDWGGLLIADGRIYGVDGTCGDVYMAAAGPGAYRELGRVNALSGKQIWGTVALADGLLIVRDQQQLKALDVRGDR